MIKKIQISEEVVKRLKQRKCVQGALHYDKVNGMTFKAYNRKPSSQTTDAIIIRTEHGWVKESTERIKTYESVPKNIGMQVVAEVLAREAGVAIEAILNIEK